MSVPELPDQSLRLASGRGVDVVAPPSSLRSLADVLTPGERVSGRVVDRFANGDYLFALRGRTLVASSDVPLATDTVVTFEVLPDDGGAIRLRIAADPAAAGAPAGAPTPVRADELIGGDRSSTTSADAGAPASTRAEDASAAPRSSVPPTHDAAPTRVAGEALRAPADVALEPRTRSTAVGQGELDGAWTEGIARSTSDRVAHGASRNPESEPSIRMNRHDANEIGRCGMFPQAQIARMVTRRVIDRCVRPRSPWRRGGSSSAGSRVSRRAPSQPVRHDGRRTRQRRRPRPAIAVRPCGCPLPIATSFQVAAGQGRAPSPEMLLRWPTADRRRPRAAMRV